MASAEDDDANIEEGECTIEFGDEDQPPPPPSTGYPLSVDGPRFVEYPGEDFSKYLSESCLPRPDYDILDDLQVCIGWSKLKCPCSKLFGILLLNLQCR